MAEAAQFEFPPGSYGFSPEPEPAVTLNLTSRIVTSYRAAAGEFVGHGASMWSDFDERQAPIMDAVKENDVERLDFLLGDPSANDFFWGYDDLVRTFTEFRVQHPETQEGNARTIYGALVQGAIGVGAIACPYPEAGQAAPQPTVEGMLSALDNVFGFTVDFPNPYRMNFGLKTSRGIISDRAIQALYQAWRVSSIVKILGSSKVLEIGAGLGRNAYYARRFGVGQYTIVDIPTTQIAQASFLGRVCGEGSINLLGEQNDAPIRLRSPAWLYETAETFDLVLNVDSLTELDHGTAVKYVEFARQNARAFLSINHEFNPSRVSALLKGAGMVPISRAPYWPRPGYVEELVLNN